MHVPHSPCILVAPEEEPVYVYDHRGLRVRASSLSTAEESTPPSAENVTVSKLKRESRPKSASFATSVCK